MKNTVGSVVLGICLSIAIVVGSIGSVWTWAKHKETMVTSISATGSANVEFKSDTVKWTARFSEKGEDIKSIYAQMKQSEDAIRSYLLTSGITDMEIEFGIVEVIERNKNNYDKQGNFIDSTFVGYTLYQDLTVVSKDIDKIEKAAKESNTLLSNGIYLETYDLKYYCTDTDSVKLSLIEKATQNAKERIDIMLKESGGTLGTLVSSRLGVFQIVPKNSGTETFAYDGANDTTSREKKGSITVRLEYTIK